MPEEKYQNRNNIEERDWRLLHKKTTNNLYSPELDLYSQGLNTFHKFPLPSETSSFPVQKIKKIKKVMIMIMITITITIAITIMLIII